MSTLASPARSGLLGVLRDAAGNADLRRLQLGSVAWASGEAAYVVGLTVVVFQMGGTGAVAVLAVIRALPSVIVAPIVTALADRVPPDTQLRVVLGARVAVVALATIVLLGGGATALLLLLAGIDAVAATLLRPIRGSLVPALARSPEELVAANVATTTGDSLAALVGPALAAVLLLVSGPALTLVAGTALLALAGASAVGLHDASARVPTGSRHGGEGRRSRFGGGLRDLAGLRHARLIVALFVIQRFVRGMFAVLVVAAAIDLLSLGEAGVGWLSSAVGLGGLAGGAVALGLVSRRRLVPPFLAGIAAWGAGIALPGLIPLPAAALLSLAVAGVGKVVLDVAGFSLLQRTVPTDIRGRVLGALEGLVTAALALGSVAAAVLIDVVGPAWAMVAAGALPIAAIALAWLRIGAADDSARVQDRELRLLRAVPLFRPLGLNALERVASAVEWREVPLATTVVRESEPGDRFYAIESGAFEVTTGGRAVRTLGAGESFGEIALLHARPRTATVTAVADGVVASIEGTAFLDAINGHRASAAAAEAQACERLMARLA